MYNIFTTYNVAMFLSFLYINTRIFTIIYIVITYLFLFVNFFAFYLIRRKIQTSLKNS